MAPQPITRAEFMRRLKDATPYALIGAFTGMGYVVSLRCTLCDARFDGVASNVLRDTKKCACRKSVTGPKPRSDAETQRAIDAARGKGYRLLPGSGSRREFRHSCGATFEAETSEMTRTKDGPKCPCEHKKITRHTLASYAATVPRLASGEYRCEEYSPTGQSMYVHAACGARFRTDWRNFRGSKNGCPACHGPKGAKLRTETRASLQGRVDAAHGAGQYEVLYRLEAAEGSGRAISDTVGVRHAPCGLEYETRRREIIGGDGRCSKCFRKQIGRVKRVVVGGVTFHCQGHEPMALADAAHRYGAKSIVSGRDPRMPKIRYRFDGRLCKYTPDVYVRKVNLLIEVKSLATMGLRPSHYDGFFAEDAFEKTQAKAAACRRQGYGFQLMLYTARGKLIDLPDDWESLPKSTVLKRLRSAV